MLTYQTGYVSTKSRFERCVTFDRDCDDRKSNSGLTADRNSRALLDGAITLTLKVEYYNRRYTFSKGLLLYLVNWRGRWVFTVNYFHFIFLVSQCRGCVTAEFSADRWKTWKINSRPFEGRYRSISPRFSLKCDLELLRHGGISWRI